MLNFVDIIHSNFILLKISVFHKYYFLQSLIILEPKSLKSVNFIYILAHYLVISFNDLMMIFNNFQNNYLILVLKKKNTVTFKLTILLKL